MLKSFRILMFFGLLHSVGPAQLMAHSFDVSLHADTTRLSHASQAQINFVNTTPDSAISLAKNSSKYLFVDFRADWCGPCIKMERTTFKDSVLVDFINRHLVAYKADTDIQINKKWVAKYRISSIPTLLIIDPDKPGEPVGRMIGFIPANMLLENLKALRDSDGDKLFNSVE